MTARHIPDASAGTSGVLIRARGLTREYPVRGTLSRGRRLTAVEAADFDLMAGETLGLVGESGSGKTTLGLALIGLVQGTRGTVHYRGLPLPAPGTADWRGLRRDLQIVFQDAAGSLDPRIPVRDQVREPLDIHGIGTVGARAEAVADMLEACGLSADLSQRFPHQLSGGQLQRVVLARALVQRPRVLVCDEPVAALDVSIRAQIVNLLLDLKRRFDLTYLFISHDLSLVRHISDRVAVMYLGRVIETGPTAEVFARPSHPYTRALISAIPVPDPARRQAPILLSGDPPSPIDRPPGCAFHPRCPVAIARCRIETPRPVPVSETHTAACILAGTAAGVHDDRQLSVVPAAPQPPRAEALRP